MKNADAPPLCPFEQLSYMQEDTYGVPQKEHTAPS